MDVAINHQRQPKSWSRLLRRLLGCRVLVAIWGTLLAAVLSVAAVAQSLPADPLIDGESIQLPARGSTPVGFTLAARFGSTDRFGQWPLRVLVRPSASSFAEDRRLTLRIEVSPESASPIRRANHFEVVVELSQGARQFDETFYLPKWFLGGRPRVRVFEAGQPLAGYDSDIDAAGGFLTRKIDELQADWVASAQGRIAWVASPGSPPLSDARDAADVEELRVLMVSMAPELLSVPNLLSDYDRLTMLVRYGNDVGLDYLTVEELPEGWLGFDRSHIWVVSWSTLDWLQANRPASVLALRQFVRCGGALWLTEAPSVDEVIGRFRETPVSPPEADEADADAANQGVELIDGERFPNEYPFPIPSLGGAEQWLSTDLVQANRALRDMLLNRGQGLGRSPDQEIGEWLRSRERDEGPQHSARVPFGAGLIVVSTYQDDGGGSWSQWRRMLDRTGGHASSVLTRGVDPIVGDGRFWNWVIPGVAQPPVYTFLTLIAIFVTVVGPVAYLKLSRMGRGYLMFFVAPLLAAVTTLLLVGYGLIADGLGTQTRIREMTLICDDSGAAVRYWRSTLFAGVRPAAGLRFPSDARVEPYYPGDFDNWYEMRQGDGSPPGSIRLDSDWLRLDQSFLPSRQQRQFVGYRPLEAAGGLRLFAEDSQQSRAVESAFDYELREVVIRDSAGDYWFVERLAGGETQPARRMADQQLAEQIGDFYLRQLPASPPGMFRRNSSMGTRLDMVNLLATSEMFEKRIPPQRIAIPEGELEWRLRSNLQTRAGLPLGTFLSVADPTADCIAVESARVVESIHYVMGVLR